MGTQEEAATFADPGSRNRMAVGPQEMALEVSSSWSPPLQESDLPAYIG